MALASRSPRRAEAAVKATRADGEQLDARIGEWRDEQIAAFGGPDTFAAAAILAAAVALSGRVRRVVTTTVSFLLSIETGAAVVLPGRRLLPIKRLIGVRPRDAAERILRAACVEYRDGRLFPLGSYVNMATASARASAAMEKRRQQWAAEGVYLWRISSHGTTCYMCIPYEGRLVATTAQGAARGFTIAPLPPYHPYCRHSAVPVMAPAPDDVGVDPNVLGASRRELAESFRREHPDLHALNKRNIWQRGGRPSKSRVSAEERERIQAIRLLLDGKATTYDDALAVTRRK